MSNFIHLTNERGETRYTTVPVSCQSCMSNCNVPSRIILCTDKKRKRQGRIHSASGSAYLCSDENDLLNSSRLFKEKLALHLQLTSELKAIRESIRSEVNKETKRLIHNLTSLNAHNIQEIYSLVPQEALAKNIRKQVSTVRSYIEGNSTEVAATLLRIAKNNISMKTEFSVFKKLYEVSPKLLKSSHVLHKVIMNVFHLFFNDFKEKYVEIQIDPNTERIFIDYESIHVALYHLIDNASKYICPNTKLNISFKKNSDYFSVVFNMISLRIEDSEIENILEEGYSGINATASEKAGSGIGMTIILKVLHLNGAKLSILKNANPILSKKIDGLSYDNNIFEIKFFPLYT